jgi:hypothetical protein
VFGKLLIALQKWLDGGTKDARRGRRYSEPSMVVHYWDGSVSEGRKIRDISTAGAFILTKEDWYLGTIVRLILCSHKMPVEGSTDSRPSQTTALSARVVRKEPDGVAVEFLLPTSLDRAALGEFLATIPKTTTAPADVLSNAAAGPVRRD